MKKPKAGTEEKAYARIVRAFKVRTKGATPADITAATGLPLATVGELVKRAADEYSGRLEVTESGEILYSFPKGFTSRYRGFAPFARRFLNGAARFFVAAGTVLFKIWIMVMLLGYFALFMAIALASLFLSAAGNSSNNRSRREGNGHLSLGIFNMIIRLWFYSELTKSARPGPDPRKSRAPSRPVHQAIFSFVFGDKDPNANWEADEKKAFIALLRERRGVISLPEFMALTGLKPDEAETGIMACCVEFNGSPEATEDGTVVYRFDEILLGSDRQREKAGFPLVFKKLLSFSSNPGTMNVWFTLINGVNLLFGSYFLYNAWTVGHISPETAQGIYGFVYAFLSSFTNPLPVISGFLGIVPLMFSVFFWLIPLVRLFNLKKKNGKLRLENFRKFSFARIWASPLAVKKADLNPAYPEANPSKNPEGFRDRVIKEMGAYSVPEVSLDEAGTEVYGFTELYREKQALEKYRLSVNPEASALGKTVFDSGA